MWESQQAVGKSEASLYEALRHSTVLFFCRLMLVLPPTYLPTFRPLMLKMYTPPGFFSNAIKYPRFLSYSTFLASEQKTTRVPMSICFGNANGIESNNIEEPDNFPSLRRGTPRSGAGMPLQGNTAIDRIKGEAHADAFEFDLVALAVVVGPP